MSGVGLHVSAKGYRVSMGGDENALKRIVVMVVHYKQVNRMVCELYLNRTVTKKKGGKKIKPALKLAYFPTKVFAGFPETKNKIQVPWPATEEVP